MARSIEPSRAAVLAQLAEDVLPVLVARLEQSRLGELEVRQDGWRVRLRRNPPAIDDVAEPPAPAGRQRERRPADGSRDGGHEVKPQPLHPVERGAVAITSPAVGYFLPRDGVAVGAAIRSGDLLGHVDVLGVRQDVVAPEDGFVAALDAQTGEAVEYGQPLARLERTRS